MSWLRLHGVDIITMAVFGAIALGIYFAGEWTVMEIFGTTSSHSMFRPGS